MAVMSFKFEFVISTRIQFELIATVDGNLYRIWDAYFELSYCLDFVSHRLRALIDDYNSLLIKVRKKSDEFNADTTAVSTRLEALYNKQLCKAWIFILSLFILYHSEMKPMLFLVIPSGGHFGLILGYLEFETTWLVV